MRIGVGDYVSAEAASEDHYSSHPVMEQLSLVN